LPKPTITPYILPPCSDFSNDSGGVNEFTSTNGSICHPNDPPLPTSESLLESPTPAVYCVLLDREINSPEFSLSPGVKDGTAQSVPQTVPIFPENRQEDVTELSFIHNHKEIHENMIVNQNLKMMFVQRKENIGKLQTDLIHEISKIKINDFKEGLIEMRGNGLLKSWKSKFCRISCSQFLIFKNLQTGLLSGIIDFKRIRTTLTADSDSLTFTYFY